MLCLTICGSGIQAAQLGHPSVPYAADGGTDIPCSPRVWHLGEGGWEPGLSSICHLSTFKWPLSGATQTSYLRLWVQGTAEALRPFMTQPLKVTWCHFCWVHQPSQGKGREGSPCRSMGSAIFQNHLTAQWLHLVKQCWRGRSVFTCPSLDGIPILDSGISYSNVSPSSTHFSAGTWDNFREYTTEHLRSLCVN